MDRREFIVSGACLANLARSLRASNFSTNRDFSVMTVEGPVRPDELGTTLTHEHVLVDFIGADKVSPDRYDPEEAFRVILPHLQKLKVSGCNAFLECTPAYLGRDPELLLRLSRESGISILTNTGYYGAAQDKYLPSHAWEETADQLAKRWTKEWEQGIGSTGIRPGFIKIGVDSGSLSKVDAKIVRAAARTHLQTGLTIMSHTGPAVPAFEQLEILQQEEVHPSAWIWTHAQGADSFEDHFRAAELGAWIAFDGLKEEAFDRYGEFLREMKRRGWLDRVLVSHDAGWYTPGEKEGGGFRGFTLLFEGFLPFLRKHGFAEEEIKQVLVGNPAEAFSVRRRPLNS